MKYRNIFLQQTYADAWLVGINSNLFKSLSKEQQDAINKAGEEVQKWNVDFMEKEDEKALQTLLDNGMEYNELQQKIVKNLLKYQNHAMENSKN